MPSPTRTQRRSDPQAPAFFSLQVREARRFYLESKGVDQHPLAVICGGVEQCASDYAIQREDFPYYSIEFVIRGQGSLALAGEEQRLFPGRLFSYGPGISQRIRTEPEDPLVKYFVDFTGINARSWLKESKLPPGTITQVSSPGDIQDMFDHLIAQGGKPSRSTPAICVKLLECLGLKLADSSLPAGVGETPAFATYLRCRQHIQTHYRELRSLEQIARECHVDPAYLCRLFRRYDHQRPYQYLTRLKMHEAAERLQTAGILVKEVADQLGYSDAFHFSRAFKNVFGLSPEMFRRLR